MSSQSFNNKSRLARRNNEHVTTLRAQYEALGTAARPGTPISTSCPAPTPRPHRTSFTGDGRVSLRERLAVYRNGFPRSSSSHAKQLTTTPPRLSPLLSVPEYPPAPRRPRGRLSAERLNASCCDDEDIFLDRRANRFEKSKKADTGKPLPSLPLSPRARNARSPLRNIVKQSDVAVAKTGSVDPEMKRLIGRNNGSGGDHCRSGHGSAKLEMAYLSGAIDNILADYLPGAMPAIREHVQERWKGEEKGRVDETMIYLCGAIDHELPGWSSRPVTRLVAREVE
ncbi:hypothetical protein TruAng_003687 [Truncatella angustata]|nr:hypothetical protein TruAng_003687 [Truncatella angustata]